MAKLVKVTHPDWGGFQEMPQAQYDKIVAKDPRFEIVTKSKRKKAKNAIIDDTGGSGNTEQSTEQSTEDDCGCP